MFPDVEEICDEVIFIEKGSLVYQGSIDALVEKNVKPDYWVKVADHGKELMTSCELKSEVKNSHKVYLVNSLNKDLLIKELFEKEIQLQHLVSHRINLEEVLYKVKHGKDDLR